MIPDILRWPQIEKRLTDKQDVMIALSEKMDAWQGQEVSGNRSA